MKRIAFCLLFAALPALACPPLLKHNFKRLQDDAPQDLCQHSGKVLLVVNTASYCGYTSQYQGLEKLYAQYKDKGLVILGFPSNDFEQEPGANKEIADFCYNTYGVKFPMYAKSSVSGAKANPLYKMLKEKSGQNVSWNFNKYLISRDGNQVSHFGSKVEPEDRALIQKLEQALAAK
ncbi:glutathione peroxidase [Massilia sp. W12]|uniref:glutathione peroxidase n=1 Tax=Massilia sp. W12 TaxID=3126507 RepID=UPI0030CD3FAD